MWFCSCKGSYSLVNIKVCNSPACLSKREKIGDRSLERRGRSLGEDSIHYILNQTTGSCSHIVYAMYCKREILMFVSCKLFCEGLMFAFIFYMN